MTIIVYKNLKAGNSPSGLADNKKKRLSVELSLFSYTTNNSNLFTCPYS